MPEKPGLLLADPEDRIFEHPELQAIGKSGSYFDEVDEWIPLPEGSKLFTLPGRRAFGWEEDEGQPKSVNEIQDERWNFAPVPVAAFLPPGYVRTHLPAAEPLEDAPVLPTWAYTCVAWRDDSFVAAAYQIDANEKWQPDKYDDRDIMPRIQQLITRFPENRLLRHLENCATHYHCFAAKNLFLNRWEAPLPVAPTCNAACLGCLSWQPEDSHSSSHNRITFRPTVQEICEVAVPHLETAPGAMVSFGQGCEGEPILEYRLIGEAITEIRKKTKRGTIHLNTNGSLPLEIEHLIEKGLDSIRITLNSLQVERYNVYFSPKNYSFSDVEESAHLAHQAGAYLHVNLLVFPGLSDQQEEIDLLLEWISRTGVNRIQLKNLCIDSDLYIKAMKLNQKGNGISFLRDILKAEVPNVALGYFNIPKEEFLSTETNVEKDAVIRVGETP